MKTGWLCILMFGTAALRVRAAAPGILLPAIRSLRISQGTNGIQNLRSQTPIRIEGVFDEPRPRGELQVEFFADDINRTNGAVRVLPLAAKGTGFEVELPGQIDRTILRYRILVRRAGDVQLASSTTSHAEWHALFISPPRDSTNRCYDLFISSNSLVRLARNIERSWKRGPNGEPPRYPTDTWDNSEPAIFVCDGVVYDVEMRHRGGMIHRSPERRSYKLKFSQRQRFEGNEIFFLPTKIFAPNTRINSSAWLGCPKCAHAGWICI